MKKGETAEFTAKWWKTSQPKGLVTAAKLETALKSYESAHGKLSSAGTADALKEAADALDAVETVVKAVIAEAKKGKSNPDLVLTADVLGKMDFGKERKSCDGLVRPVKPGDAANTGEEEETGIADPDDYKKILRTGLRKLDTGELNFGFVVGKKAINHRLLFSRSTNGRVLAAKAASQLGLHVFTFGTAKASPDRPDTVLLHLEGKQLPGLAKKGGRMLKAFKPQPYARIALFVDGIEAQDIVDETDDETDDDTDDVIGDVTGDDSGEPKTQTEGGESPLGTMRQEMTALGDTIRLAIANHPDKRGTLTTLVGAFNEAIEGGDEAKARRILAGVAKSAKELAESGPEIAKGTVAYSALLLDWQAARNGAAASLKALEAAILKDFDGDEDYDDVTVRIRKLDVILATLGGDLQDKLDEAMNTTSASRGPINREAQTIIDRYREYVENDPFVAEIEDNPYVPVNVKSRLSASLANLTKALAA